MSSAVKYVLAAWACVFSLGSTSQTIDLGELDRDPGYIFFNGRAQKLSTGSIIPLDSVLKPFSQSGLKHWPINPLFSMDSIPTIIGTGSRPATLTHCPARWSSCLAARV